MAVLVDTEHLWDEVREELTGEWGGRYTPEAQQAMMGMSSPEWSRYMHEHVGLPESPAVIAAEVVERMAERYRERLPLYWSHSHGPPVVQSASWKQTS